MFTLPSRIEQWMPQLRAAESCYQVPSMLLAAMMDRESMGGEALEPKGPTGTGDAGHGRGLMQIDDRWHKGFIEATCQKGLPLWQDATFNVLYAARYFAALRDELSGLGVDPEVCAIAAYNCGPGKVREAVAGKGISRSALLTVLDPLTTGGDYLTDVLVRKRKFILLR